MSQTNPAASIVKLTIAEYGTDHIRVDSKGISYRKIFCIGGTQVILEFKDGTETTFLAAEYEAINNQSASIKTIKSGTDCDMIFASV